MSTESRTSLLRLVVKVIIVLVLFLVLSTIPVSAERSTHQEGQNFQINTIVFPSTSGPLNTSLSVDMGDIITITATGIINNGGSDPSYPPSSPDGLLRPCNPACGFSILPNISATSLVGSIGSSFQGIALLDDGRDINPQGISGSNIGYPGIFGPGYVGSSFSEIANSSGEIYIAFNDAPLYDNSGSFTIIITIVKPNSLTFKSFIPIIQKT